MKNPFRKEKVRKGIILVHGSFHGGWCWERVAPALKKQGFRVYTPTLPGLAENDGHDVRKITLNDHISAVVELIDQERVDEVVLVGHSHAGFVITGVVDRVRSKVSHVIYLDAFIPKDGKRFVDYVSPEAADDIIKPGEENGGAVPPFPVEFFGLKKKADVEFVKTRLQPHPLRTFTDAIHLSDPNVLEKVSKTYVYATKNVIPAFAQFVDIAKEDPTWEYIEIDDGHELMILRPKETIRIITAVAGKM